MPKKRIAPLFVGAVLLFALAPSKALAQTRAAEGGRAPTDAPARPKTDLKAAFAGELADVRARSSAAPDYRRIERQEQERQAKKASGHRWTKREKIGLIVGGLVILAVTVILLVEGIADEPPFCFEAPDDPYCR